MKIRSIFVYTHDSIGLGEDGPTHQSIEHVASLRLIPQLNVWRPCDTVETAVAWAAAIERRDGPSALVLTRQNLPAQPRSAQQINAVARGGYVLRDSAGTPDVILIATGSEVQLAVGAVGVLAQRGVQARVVSMPNTRIFDQQDAAYRDSVLPPDVTARVAVEAGVTDYWWRFVGTHGAVVGIDTFGESAPAKDVFAHFGFTVDNVVQTAERILK